MLERFMKAAHMIRLSISDSNSILLQDARGRFLSMDLSVSQYLMAISQIDRFNG